MHALAPGITVNGILISPEQISAEVQYHPAPTLVEAKYEAMRALVVRELLIQEAVIKGLGTREQAHVAPDRIIDELLKTEISAPQATLEECRRYYDNNRQKFHTSPILEASHILYLAPPNDDAARKKALEKARKTLAQIQQDRSAFKDAARRDSACPSAAEGGYLGKIGKGQTVPAFEAALMKMQAGDISAEPVLSDVGYHIIFVHTRTEGSCLPFESVQEWIAKSLNEQSWRQAFSQYVQILAGKAKISGFQLRSADTPLVQ